MPGEVTNDMPFEVWLLADEEGDIVGYPYERPDLTRYVRLEKGGLAAYFRAKWLAAEAELDQLRRENRDRQTTSGSIGRTT